MPTAALQIADTQGRPLEDGKWYALGFANDEQEIEWGAAQLCRYDGDGQWSDDDGSPVDRAWDPGLQLWVSPNACDGYMRQS